MSGPTLIPIPQSPIGTLEQSSGRIIMGREWYRFFGLLQSALGGSSDIVSDTNEQLPSAEQLIGDTFTLIASALTDAGGIALAARSAADDLQRRVMDLESRLSGFAEMPLDRIAALEAMMPGPVTLGTIAAQNANAVTITGGTAVGLTVLSVTLSTNADLPITITNSNAGGAATSVFKAANGTATAQFAILGHSYTLSGMYAADGAVVTNDLGTISIITQSNKSVFVGVNNTKVVEWSAAAQIMSIPFRLKSYTVATLPAGTEGDTAYVTDATAPTYLGALTGGGAVRAPVFYNNAAWVSG